MAPTSSVMSRIRMFEQQACSNGSPGTTSSFQRTNTRGERSWPPQTESTKKNVGSSTAPKAQKKPPAFLSHFQKPAVDAETRHDASTVSSPGSQNQESARNGSPERRSYHAGRSSSEPLSSPGPTASAPKETEPSWSKQKRSTSREVLGSRLIDPVDTNNTPLKGNFTSTKKDEGQNPKSPDENDAPAIEKEGMDWPSQDKTEVVQGTPFHETKKAESKSASHSAWNDNSVTSEAGPTEPPTPDSSTPMQQDLGWPSLEMPPREVEGDVASPESMPTGIKSDSLEKEIVGGEVGWPSPGSELEATVASSSQHIPEPDTETFEERSKNATPDRKDSSTVRSNISEQPSPAPVAEHATLLDAAATPKARSQRIAMLRSHGRPRATSISENEGGSESLKSRIDNTVNQLSLDKTNLKRNLESASVVMQEEKVSSIASGSSSKMSSLSTDELSSIAMRAYNASKKPTQKDKASLGEKLKRMKQNAPPKRIQHSNNKYDGDDVSTVGSDSTSHTKASARSARFSALQSRTTSPAPSLDSEGECTLHSDSTPKSRSSTRSSRLQTLMSRNQTKIRSHLPTKQIEGDDASTVASDATPHSRSSARSTRLSTAPPRRTGSPARPMPTEVTSTKDSDARPLSQSSSRSNRMSTLASAKRSSSRSPAPLRPTEAISTPSRGTATASQARSSNPSVDRSSVFSDSQSQPTTDRNPTTISGGSHRMSTLPSAKRSSSRSPAPLRPTKAISAPSRGSATTSEARPTATSVDRTSASSENQSQPSTDRNTTTTSGASKAVSSTRPLSSRASRRASRMAKLNRTKSGSPVPWTTAKTNEEQPSQSDSATAVLRQTRSASPAPNTFTATDNALKRTKSSGYAARTETEAGPMKVATDTTALSSPKQEYRNEPKTQHADDALSVTSDGTSKSIRSHRSMSRKHRIESSKRIHRSPSPSPGRRLQQPGHIVPIRAAEADDGNGSVASVESSKFKSIGSAFKNARITQSPSRGPEKCVPPSTLVLPTNETSKLGALSSPGSHQHEPAGTHPQTKHEAQDYPESGGQVDTTGNESTMTTEHSNLRDTITDSDSVRDVGGPTNKIHQESNRGVGSTCSVDPIGVNPHMQLGNTKPSSTDPPAGNENEEKPDAWKPQADPVKASSFPEVNCRQTEIEGRTQDIVESPIAEKVDNDAPSGEKPFSRSEGYSILAEGKNSPDLNIEKRVQSGMPLPQALKRELDVGFAPWEHRSAKSREHEDAAFGSPAQWASETGCMGRSRIDRDTSMLLDQAHVGSQEGKTESDKSALPGHPNTEAKAKKKRVSEYAKNSAPESLAETEESFSGKLETLHRFTNDENRSQPSFGTTSRTTASSSSTPDALEWWQKNYAFTQDQNVNEVVKKALSPSASSAIPTSGNSSDVARQRVQPLTIEADDEDLDDIFSGLDEDATESQHESDAEGSNTSLQDGVTQTTSSQMGTMASDPADSFGDDVFSGVGQSTNSNNCGTEYSASQSRKSPAEQKAAPVKAPPPPPPKTGPDDPSGAILDGPAVMDTVNSDITSSVLGGEPSPWEPTDWSRPPKDERLDVVEEEIDGDNQSEHRSKEDGHSHNNDSRHSKSKRGADDSISAHSLRNASGSIKQVEINDSDSTSSDEGDADLDVSSSPKNESLFMNFGWGLIESFANGLCRGPGQDLGTNSMEDVDDDDSGSKLEVETIGNEDAVSVAGSYTSQTVTTMHTMGSVTSAASATLSEKERRVWDDWERRDSLTAQAKSVSLLGSPKAERKEQGPSHPASHPERRAAAREKLLGYAYSALKVPFSETKESMLIEESSTMNTGESSSLHTPDTCSETDEADEGKDQKADGRHHSSTGDTKGNAASPPLPKQEQITQKGPDMDLSFNQRRILEHFSSRLKNQGLEVLKLSRDKKWQLRYLTASKEVTWLNMENSSPGDRGQCPRGILWLKKFNSKSKDHSISAIDKQGRGGVLCLQLQKVSAAGKGDPQFPVSKKHQARFINPAAINVEYSIRGASRSITFLCQSTDEAHFLCAGMRVVIDVLKRESSPAPENMQPARYPAIDTTEPHATAQEI